MDVYGQVIQTMPRDTVDPQLLQAMDTIVAEADLEYVTTEIPKALQQSLDGTERVGNIVRAMKDFSHPGTAEKKPIDLNKAIESTVTVARNEWKYVADLVLNLDPTLPPVACLPGELNQVILNLLVNAAHAIGTVAGKAEGAKGTITITTRMQEDWIEIQIADTGTGIPESARDKIFDPFFTTKEVGKGTGQGLAMAHDVIVKKHGGTLTFETEMGKGTTFIIQLPRQLGSKAERHDETTNLVCG
jgi:signal transduction histidine kinase